MGRELKGKHFVTTQDWELEELGELFARAGEYKAAFGAGQFHFTLEGKTLGMIFFDPSTRTRTSFEAAMTQLGGHGIFFDPGSMQISHGEGAMDTARVLSGYLQGIAVRFCQYGEGNRYLREMQKYSAAPVVNMQCDIYHPAQVLADYFTILEHFGERYPGNPPTSMKGLKMGISWTYAPNYLRPLSVPQSLMLLMPRFGIDVTLAHPPGFELMPEILDQSRKNAEKTGARISITHDMNGAFQDADIIVAKSWGPLTHTRNPDEGRDMMKKYSDWICDEAHMDITRPHSIYMHPLPADRGREVTPGVIDGPRSVVYQQAQNRLHVQKALLSMIM